MRRAIDNLTVLIGDRALRFWLAIVGLGVVSGIFEMVGTLLVFGLLSLFVSSRTSIHLPVLGTITAPSMPRNDFLLLAAAATLLFFVIRGVYFVVETYVENRIVLNTGVGIAERLFRGYLDMPYA
ncbi:MAG: hypothetical protein M3290_04115, partial [Actinomycetota bacterium]|nr:hypothetical protein [Actinomycetota bacterium]